MRPGNPFWEIFPARALYIYLYHEFCTLYSIFQVIGHTQKFQGESLVQLLGEIISMILLERPCLHQYVGTSLIAGPRNIEF